MIQILNYNQVPPEQVFARTEPAMNVEAIVTEIIANVRSRGDRALYEYCKKFDKAALTALQVSPEEIDEAVAAVEPRFLEILEAAAANIRAFHSRQVRNSFVISEKNGIVLGQKIIPVDRAGLYVPGGTAAYPSTVLMDSIPAKIAGVREVVMVTPPNAAGKVNPVILAAAKVAGVDKIFKVGGAQAIAALAYGTESIPKVDKIVGPGNIFVATAKRLTYGVVDIDMIAGPSEILILADETANPKYLAADLMSQAEHDMLASAILITTSETVAAETAKELDIQIQTLSRQNIIRKSLEDYGAAIVCRDMQEAVDFANRLAPEHLEVMCEDPMSYIGRLDNAGSVFLGQYAPEPLGDYYAGPNHVLPTGGTARFFSPLSVDSFVKKSSFIYYKRDALAAACDDIVTLANAEGLDAHAHAVAVRFE